jgi:vacuolar iron transporter family protein
MQDNKPDELNGGVEGGRSLSSAIRDLIFGAEDGLVSILGLVTGVAAGSANSSVVLLAGAVGALSGAISMAAGNYLGAKSHIEVLEHRLQQEKRSIAEHPEHERAELVDYFRSRGLTPGETSAVVPAIERNKDFLMEEMAAHELGISPSELQNPIWKAVWIFVAYIIASVFPVLPYVLFPRTVALEVSVAATVVVLFVVGAVKTIYTKRSPIRSGLEMLAIAALAGIAGYLAGLIIALA